MFAHREDGDDHGGKGNHGDAADEEDAGPGVMRLGAMEHGVADSGRDCADARDSQVGDNDAFDLAMLGGRLEF